MRAKTRLIIFSGALVSALLFALVPIAAQPASPVSESLPVPVVYVSPMVETPHLVHAAASPAPSIPASVTVRSGDSLTSIARLLGVSWMQLAGFNHVSDPNLILPGLVLRRPPPGYVPPAPTVVAVAAVRPSPAPVRSAGYSGAGVYSYSMLESLWVQAGGPSWAASHAAEIALCESHGEPWAHNPSGATGLWQILGQVVAGNLYDPMVNAENAVAKFRDRGDTFGAWVCQ